MNVSASGGGFLLLVGREARGERRRRREAARAVRLPLAGRLLVARVLGAELTRGEHVLLGADMTAAAGLDAGCGRRGRARGELAVRTGARDERAVRALLRVLRAEDRAGRARRELAVRAGAR